MMNIEEIQSRLAKPATKLIAGGFRPTEEPTESWIGKVFLFREDEDIPLNSSGEQMLPYAQLHLPSLPVFPEVLAGIELLTVFMSPEFPGEFEPMGANWIVREYRTISELKRKDLRVQTSFLKAFPLQTEFIEKDYPQWEGDVPVDVADAVLKLEDEGEIEDYYDIVEHVYTHKVGGYPSFCQSGVDFGDGFEFAFQISSDAKINLNVVDNGSLMFARNKETGEWKLYYDFY